MKFYACFFKDTKEKVIFEDWETCKKNLIGKNNKFKSFKTKIEALAWLENIETPNALKEENILFFDSGTGRKKGVEIKVVNENKENMLCKIIETNENETYLVKPFQGISNNYGELLALYYALKIALKTNIKKIYGDSKLILDYWSKGRYNKTIPLQTQDLIEKVKALRLEFEKSSGILQYINGKDNLADLGFHK